MTDKDRLLTDNTVKSRTVLEFASGKGHAYKHHTHTHDLQCSHASVGLAQAHPNYVLLSFYLRIGSKRLYTVAFHLLSIV